MATVINQSQQVVAAGISPRAAYSRVVNLYLCMAAGLGNDDIQVTPPLGNNLWLYELKITCMPYSVVNLGQGFIYVTAGSGKNPSGEDVAVAWDPVIPNYGPARQAFQFYGLQQQFTWKMQRKFTGEARRFGCVIENLSATVAMRVWVSFNFTEG